MNGNKVNSNIERIYSLTPLQNGILYHYILEKESRNYISQESYQIAEKLDENKLKQVLHCLEQKYPVLRTSIIYEKLSKPRQVILKEREIEYERIELIECDNSRQEEILNKILNEDVNRGFNLQKNSLLRVKYITVGSKDYIIWTTHHILLDGWSCALIIEDFVRYYNMLQSVKTANMIEKVIHEEKNEMPEFDTYVNWIYSQDMDSASKYWNKLTEDYNGIAEIKPVMKPSKTEKQVNYIEITESQKLSDELIKVAQQYNVTVNNLLEAAWGIVLQRYNNTDDVIFGKVVSGRDVPISGLEKTIGLYINTIPLRVKTAHDMTIENLLLHLKEQGIESKSYEYYSLAEIQSATKQRSDLIKTLFVFENYYKEDLRKNDHINLTLINNREQTNYAITFEASLVNTTLHYDILYNPNEYAKLQIEEILSHVKKVLEAIALSTDMLIRDIDIVTEEDKNKIFGEFNYSYMYLPEHKTVIDLFEEQVHKNPEKIAVEYEGQKISYEDLNKKANQLARRLQKIGVGRDDFVAILMEKNIEMVIGILGILKAGGAFVPLDVDYPAQRLEYMLKDCNPKAILVYNTDIVVDIPKVNLNDNSIFIGLSSNLNQGIDPNSLFYCIYTSGTNGKPKGVLLEHKVIFNLILCGFNYIGMLPFQRVAWTTNLTFDPSTHEIFSTLLCGGTGLIIDNKVKKEINLCIKRLKEFKAKTIFTTPSYFNILVSEDRQYFSSGLEQIVLAGEEFKINPTFRFEKNVVFYNFYGPSETHCATFKKVEVAELENKNIPIGKPFSNFQIYIRQNDRLQGIGMVGEIYIAGVGLARGYLKNEKLTTEKFVKNVYGEGRMYRTGDLGRWLPDGNIEYLGRIDDQIKIRGQRIELGEIENVLKNIEYVKDCAVIAKLDKNEEKEIYAYIVSDIKVNVSELRDKLRESLPLYMIPTYMIQIEKVPITKNGKLDRHALPEIELSTRKEYETPKNETEEILCSIYQEILNREKVGINDGFFELGGHSLRAFQVINRIEEKMGVRLDMKEIFRMPTVKGLSEKIRLHTEKNYETIPKAKESTHYPMSATQKRIYLVCHMENVGLAYNIPKVMKLTGEVCPEKIRMAMQDMVNRHEILRTGFGMKEGEPLQLILKDAQVDYIYIEDSESSEEKLIKEFIQPFNLGKPPLFRSKLVKRKSDYLLMLDTHHIVSDGISIGTFLKEFGILYNGGTLNATRQYKDYSEWMRERDLSTQKEYWLNEFSGVIPVLDIPTDYARKHQMSFRGATITAYIDKEIRSKIKKLIENTGTTEYMVFLSVAIILMAEYSRQEDIVIGSPISARTHKDTEGMLGMFVNTLAMKGVPKGEKRYSEFLQEIKNTCLKAYENQEYPFEELVDSLNIPRDMSRNPLFDVMLILHNNEEVNLQLNKIKKENLHIKDETSKFSLLFDISKDYDGYEIGLEYCADLFRATTAEKILKHYFIVLEQIVEDKDKRIDEIEVITQEERKKILEEFNNTYVDYDRSKTVVDLFEKQVERTPKKLAVVYEEESITYKELNRKANQLARKLRELGVESNDFVIIYTERSIEMLVGVLGILKAGGAYVPIELGYPQGRIDNIVEDCHPKVVVVYGCSMKTDIPIINLSKSEIYQGIATNLERYSQPDDFSFCTYTSGTTGKPKGIPVHHKNIMNLVHWYQNYFDITEKDKVIIMASLSFNMTQRNIFAPLISGGTVYACGKGNEFDAIRTARYIKVKKITMVNCAASAFYVLVMVDQINQYRSLKSLEKVYLVGESLSYVRIKDYMQSNNCKAKVVNGYGATENTGMVCAYVLSNNVMNQYADIIGKPLYNEQVYIIEKGKLCGIGIKGEICIAGEGVTGGYLNHEALTIKKFVKNPFGNGKMYRTGDWGRWLPDGNIEFLGRMDDQVKIRGRRIELGEIESVLRNISYVKDCAVITRKDKSGDKEIYAYVISERKVNVSELRDLLSKSLPEYMIPAYIGQIEKLPVTKNGKLDKRALPELEASTGKEYETPRNRVEEILCGIYQEILNVEKVGINDGFFELGGHSLRAIRVINSIEEKTGVRLEIKEIFNTPTIKGLSNKIIQHSQQNYEKIPRVEEKDYYLMSSTQKRTYLICHMNHVGLAYNMPRVMKLTGEVYPDRIKIAMQRMIDRHEILRTEFGIYREELVQRICKDVQVDYRYIEDNTSSEEELIHDFIRPFNLGKSSLFRSRLVKRENNYLLMLDTHHIVSDGISEAIFTKEFNMLYAGKSLKMPRQYKDYSEWMRMRDLSEQKAYWESKFFGEIPVLDIPTDYQRPHEQSFNGNIVETKLNCKLSEKIRKLAEETGTTDYMIFLSAAMILLSKYSGQEDIVIGSPVSGRTHKDTEGMLGMFANTLAMRGLPVGEKKFVQFLDEIKEICLKAYENQEYPFEELLDSLDITRDRSRNPLFDVMLILHNNEMIDVNLQGTRMEEVQKTDFVSKFDLTFTLLVMGEEYKFVLEYCNDLFCAETAKRMTSHYKAILEQIVKDRNQIINEMEAITEEEYKEILRNFNNTHVEYDRSKTILDLFEEQVDRTPENIAILYENESLSYNELNNKANQIARKLRALGVRSNDYVAMLVPRSIEMFIGLYGILKAGGAYVPMNPEYPKDRIQYMIEDCCPKVVVIYGCTIDTDLPVLDLSESKIYSGLIMNLEKVNTPENLIYCTYTSGTTGKPKGIPVRYSNVDNLVNWYKDYFHITQRDKVLLMASLSFDLTQRNIFAPHVSGGMVCCYGDENKYDAIGTAEIINAKKITIVNCAASAFYALIMADKSNDYRSLSSLEKVYLVGETLSYDRIKGYMSSEYCNAQIINGYGATEDSGIASTYRVEKQQKKWNIPIGKPLYNKQMYIIQNGKLCGIGIKGEICICGEGVTDGYLNKEELTAEKFVKNPYGQGKMYHTGDLGCWLSDGNIKFLGRIDAQVKIRGFRIELGEIESILRKITYVKDCTVITKEDQSGEKAIYAYFISDIKVNVSELRNMMAKSLPEYMLPTYIGQIERLPITKNGKLDKRALPELKASTGKEYKMPTNKTEEILCGIYEEILNVEKVGINDNFFELGGHSLKVIRVINRIEEKTGMRIKIRNIFDHPTVKNLSKIMKDNATEEFESIPLAEEKECYQMSSTQKRTFLICQMDNIGISYNISKVMRLTGKIRPEKIQEAMQEMINRHEILRTEFGIKEDEMLQWIRKNVKADHQYIEDKETREDKLIHNFIRSFDLGKAPLIRSKLVKRNNCYLLIIDTHHIVSDGMSIGTFMREFSEIYNRKK